jgi:hypothetical protein
MMDKALLAIDMWEHQSTEGCTNTRQSTSPTTQGQLNYDRHIANNTKPNTANTIAKLGLSSAGISDRKGS